MPDPSMVFYLAMITLIAALAYGLWQFFQARKAKQQHQSSAFVRPSDSGSDHRNERAHETNTHQQ